MNDFRCVKGCDSMKKSTVFFLCTTMMLLGTVIGFLLAPAKKGISIGSNNSNNGNNNSAEKKP
jgi:hypothetical protein